MRRFKAQAQLLALFTLLAVFACDRVTPVAPVGSTITISINPSRIDAQGEAALVTIIVRKEDGTPVNPGTQVNVSTTLGTVDPEVVFTDETGVAKADLTGDGRIGMATVSATTGAAALVSVDVQIGSVAASITLTATPTNVPKDPQGEEGVIELTALIRDDTGAPLGGGVVNFATDIGSLDSRGEALVTDDLGKVVDILRVTRNDISTLLDPFFLVSAETAIEGGSLILDELEIDVRGVPANISLQATPAAVADVGGDTILTAIVRDGLGDGLAGASVNFLTDLGSLASGGSILTSDAQGQARDTLTLTENDIGTLGSATTFNVRVETAGLAGAILDDTFQIRIASCRPVAIFRCDQVGGAQYRFDWNAGDPGTLFFKWTFTPPSGIAVIVPEAQGNVTQIPTLTPDGSHSIRLDVRDELCGDPPGFIATSLMAIDVPTDCPGTSG